MNTPKYKAVIFDLDDTLLMTRQIKFEHHKFVAKKFYNHDLTDEELVKHWGKPTKVLIAEWYKNLDTYEKIYEKLISIRESFSKQEYPGAREIVEKLLDTKYQVGIVTAAEKIYALKDLRKWNFPCERMLEIQAADDTEHHKPDPRVFVPILEKFAEQGIQNHEIVYVGDSVDDFHASVGAGMGFIAVTTGLYREEDFRELGAEVVLKDIRELEKELRMNQ